MANPNPNEPNFPYSGGTDNPGDDTSHPGGPTNVASTESSIPTLAARAPGLPPTIAAGQSDTVLPSGVKAVPPTAAGFESLVDRGADPEGGVDPMGGARESGQDETAGATETTSGVSPVAFP